VGGNTDMWEPFASQFSTRRIIMFDAPGCGQSSTPVYPVTIPSLADLVIAVLDHCGAPWADVVGFSYGGIIAQQLAHDHPTRVRRLVLAATHCGIGAVPGSIGAMMEVATPLRFYSPTHFARIAAICYGGVTARDPSARRRMMVARHNRPPSPYGYALQFLGIVGWSSLPFLASIPHETLVITGDDDPLVPMANSKMLAQRIPHARLEIVAQGGHLLLWDDPKTLGARILPFVNARRATEVRSSAT
jgi:pimeloyl-ACP methyl ester carboxylesterase